MLSCVFEVLKLTQSQKRIDVCQLEVCQERGEFILGFKRGNAIQFRLKRFQTLPVDGVGVGAGGVKVANFLLVCGAVRTSRRRFFEKAAQDALGLIEQHVEVPVAGVVRGHGMELAEIAAGVLIEIHAGIRGFVDGRQVEPRRRCGRCCIGSRGGLCEHGKAG